METNLSKNDLILERLEQIKDRNKKAYYNRNLDQYSSTEVSFTYQNVAHLGICDLIDFELSATIKKLKLKIKTISSLMKLFFALYKEERIIAPSINSTLEGLYQKSFSLIAFVSQFWKVLEIHTKEYCKKRGYLNCSNNMLYL